MKLSATSCWRPRALSWVDAVLSDLEGVVLDLLADGLRHSAREILDACRNLQADVDLEVVGDVVAALLRQQRIVRALGPRGRVAFALPERAPSPGSRGLARSALASSLGLALAGCSSLLPYHPADGWWGDQAYRAKAQPATDEAWVIGYQSQDSGWMASQCATCSGPTPKTLIAAPVVASPGHPDGQRSADASSAASHLAQSQVITEDSARLRIALSSAQATAITHSRREFRLTPAAARELQSLARKHPSALFTVVGAAHIAGEASRPAARRLAILRAVEARLALMNAGIRREQIETHWATFQQGRSAVPAITRVAVSSLPAGDENAHPVTVTAMR